MSAPRRMSGRAERDVRAAGGRDGRPRRPALALLLVALVVSLQVQRGTAEAHHNHDAPLTIETPWALLPCDLALGSHPGLPPEEPSGRSGGLHPLALPGGWLDACDGRLALPPRPSAPDAPRAPPLPPRPRSS